MPGHERLPLPLVGADRAAPGRLLVPCAASRSPAIAALMRSNMIRRRLDLGRIEQQRRGCSFQALDFLRRAPGHRRRPLDGGRAPRPLQHPEHIFGGAIFVAHQASSRHCRMRVSARPTKPLAASAGMPSTAPSSS